MFIVERDAALCLKEWSRFMNDTPAFDVVCDNSGGWFLLACSDGVLWFNEGQWDAVLEYWRSEDIAIPGDLDIALSGEDL